MKLCITSQGDSLDSQVDPRFGRCAWFLIVDSDTLQVKAIDNSQSLAMSGAGVQSGQLLSQENVETVLTGNAGPNAFQTLNAAGIAVITGVSGTVRQAVEKFKKGEYAQSDRPNVDSHFGLK